VPAYDPIGIGGFYQDAFTLGAVRHFKGVADILVALAAIDALQLTRFFSD